MTMTSKSFYPSLPSLYHFERLFDWTALLTTVFIMGTLAWVLRVYVRTTWVTIGIACLPVSAILWIIGKFALQNNTVPEEVGPWAVTMLLGVLYPILFCGGCVVFDSYAVWHRASTLETNQRIHGKKAKAPR